MPVREILAYINKRAALDGEVSDFLKAVFHGSSSADKTGKEIRTSIVRRIMWLLIKNKLNGKKASDCVNLLIPEVIPITLCMFSQLLRIASDGFFTPLLSFQSQMDAVPDEEFIDLVEIILWGIEKGKESQLNLPCSADKLEILIQNSDFK